MTLEEQHKIKVGDILVRKKYIAGIKKIQVQSVEVYEGGGAMINGEILESSINTYIDVSAQFGCFTLQNFEFENKIKKNYQHPLTDKFR